MSAINFYTTDEDKSTVQEFLDEVSSSLAQKTLLTFKLVTEISMVSKTHKI